MNKANEDELPSISIHVFDANDFDANLRMLCERAWENNTLPQFISALLNTATNAMAPMSPEGVDATLKVMRVVYEDRRADYLQFRKAMQEKADAAEAANKAAFAAIVKAKEFGNDA